MPNLFLTSPTQSSLPSWNDGPTKNALVDFVARVTNKSGPNYVSRSGRIAVFDTDGTLWPERPMSFQAAFAIDRMKLLASQHARWTEAPLAHAILAGDLNTIAGASERQLHEILAWTHVGLSTDAFEKIVRSWVTGALHPTFKCRYAELAYRPMQELLIYLRVHGFKTFLISGGSVEFVRVFAEQLYDIPPEQVIGSSIATRLEFDSGKPQLVKQSRIEFVDDGVGKPSGIDRFIGRRPIFAIGNSDGDQQMLQWIATRGGAHFVGLLHHTDALREFSYDYECRGGQLTKALAEARARHWPVIGMAKDWLRVFSERVSR